MLFSLVIALNILQLVLTQEPPQPPEAPQQPDVATQQNVAEFIDENLFIGGSSSLVSTMFVCLLYVNCL